MSDNDTYHTALVNDDSDEEDVSVTLGIAKSGSPGGTTMDIPKVLSMEDFNELKKKTLDLVDPEWKQSRNKELLAKMLALDSPSITPQVSSYVSYSNSCHLAFAKKLSLTICHYVFLSQLIHRWLNFLRKKMYANCCSITSRNVMTL